MLAALGILRGVGLRAAHAGHVVAPVLVQLAQDLEFLVLGKIHLVALGLGGVGRGGLGVSGVGGRAVAVGAVGIVGLGRFVEADALHRQLFQRGVALQFLLD